MLNKLLLVLGYLKLNWISLIVKSAKVGEDCRIDYNVNIININSKVIIGDNVYLRGIAKGYQAGMSFPTTILADIPDSLIKIGNNCRINGAYIHAQNSIIIGNNCVIASNVNIIDTNGHEVYSKNRTIGRDKPLEIILEDNVWIGLNVIILKGTRIGRNSIVSAGSVVKGNFEENSIITGNPAKVVKKIFINETSYT
jgi:acetyltransferase-like isoleucine patch superfamily enzyme